MVLDFIALRLFAKQFCFIVQFYIFLLLRCKIRRVNLILIGENICLIIWDRQLNGILTLTPTFIGLGREPSDIFVRQCRPIFFVEVNILQDCCSPLRSCERIF